MAKDKRDKYEKSTNQEAFIAEGTLVHADHNTLCETTILSEREIYAFATNDVRRAALDPRRKEPIGKIFIERVMRYKKSLEGRGIDDLKTLYQVATEEKQAEANKGAYFG